MVDKDYKQEFQKVDGEHSTPVDVVTQPHTKRCNVDEVGMSKDQDAIVEDIYAKNVFAEEELELMEDANIGVNLSNRIAESLIGIFAHIVYTVPQTPTSSGSKGDIAYDSNYMYVCIADNQWKRIAYDNTWSA